MMRFRLKSLKVGNGNDGETYLKAYSMATMHPQKVMVKSRWYALVTYITILSNGILFRSVILLKRM